MIHRSLRLPKNVQEKIFTSFVDDKTAVQTTIDIGRDFYDRKPSEWKRGLRDTYIPSWHASFHITVLRHFKHFRETIVAYQQSQYPKLGGEIEIDLAMIGGHKKRPIDELRDLKKLLGIKVGKPVRRRKSRAKTHFQRPVLGILQRGGTLVLLPIESRARAFLELMIRQIVQKGSVVYTDGEKGLNELKMLGYMHRVVIHEKGHVNPKGWHINGIESVFRETKAALRKNFKGVPRSTLDLHIKEREFRYNHRNDLEKALKSLLKGI